LNISKKLYVFDLNLDQLRLTFWLFFRSDKISYINIVVFLLQKAKKTHAIIFTFKNLECKLGV